MLYFITKSDIFDKLKESFTFSFNDKYLANVFYGIMPDIGATEISIVEEF